MFQLIFVSSFKWALCEVLNTLYIYIYINGLFYYSALFLSQCYLYSLVILIPSVNTNDTVNQHENPLSGTWEDAEQECGGVCRKQFDLLFV